MAGLDLLAPLRRRRPAGTLVLVLAAIAVSWAIVDAAPPEVGRAEARAPGAGGGQVRLHRNLRYAWPPAARVDVYRRARSVRPVPAVLVVHGGGWRYGDKRRMVRVSRRLARAGLVAFNVNYTLARPGRPGLRSQPRELRAAVRWIRRNSARFGVDPRRIGAFGSSAGGHLVGLLATQGRGPLGSGARIRAAATWSAPFDLPQVDAPILSHAIDVFLGCTERPCAARREAASPTVHVSPDDPPMLIVNSRRELVPAAQAESMARRLASAGVPHRLWMLEGTRHGRGYLRTALRPTIAFLRGRLR